MKKEELLHNDNLKFLTQRERLILRLFYISEISLEEIAERLGICYSRASQLKLKAISKYESNQIS